MSALKEAIFGEVKKNFGEAGALNSDQLNKLLFHHPDGLRLSLKGFVVIKSIFTAYSFEMPETIKAKHQHALSKMEYPYFVTKRRLILFSDMDAMMIKIHGGVQGFLETYTKID